MSPRRIRVGRRTTLRVSVSREGKRLAGARVRLGGFKATTDGNGIARLRVRVKRPGPRRLIVTAANARPVRAQIELK